jgi:hypothetical protein
MQQELDIFTRWYNELRPHSTFGGRTPAEVYSGQEHPTAAQRIEPRARYPVPAEDLDSGRVIRVQHIRLKPEHFEGRRHLPAPVLDLAA